MKKELVEGLKANDVGLLTFSPRKGAEAINWEDADLSDNPDAYSEADSGINMSNALDSTIKDPKSDIEKNKIVEEPKKPEETPSQPQLVKRGTSRKDTKTEMIDTMKHLTKFMIENKTSWMDFFYLMDSRGREKVSSYEVYSLLVREQFISKKLATQIVKEIDFDRDGFATIHEWMKYETKLPKEIQVNAYYKGADFQIKLFNCIKDHRITWVQLYQKSLKDESKTQSPTSVLLKTMVDTLLISRSATKEFLQKLDKDQDGMIELSEWNSYFREEDIYDQEVKQYLFPKKVNPYADENETIIVDKYLKQNPNNIIQKPIFESLIEKEEDFGVPMPVGDFILFVEGDFEMVNQLDFRTLTSNLLSPQITRVERDEGVVIEESLLIGASQNPARQINDEFAIPVYVGCDNMDSSEEEAYENLIEMRGELTDDCKKYEGGLSCGEIRYHQVMIETCKMIEFKENKEIPIICLMKEMMRISCIVQKSHLYSILKHIDSDSDGIIRKSEWESFISEVSSPPVKPTLIDILLAESST